MSRKVRFRHRLEAVVVRGWFTLCGCLSVDRASALGGFLGRVFGPWSEAHATAKRNLSAVFPDMDDATRNAVLTRMWDNLGRVAAEYPHLKLLVDHRTEFVGFDHVERASSGNRTRIYVSGHYGNWEIAPAVCARFDLPPTIVYRGMNNPLVDDIVRRMRAPASDDFVNKGQSAGRQILSRLRKGRPITLLIDQKANNGVAVPLFGRDAMTSPAVAQIALSLNSAVIPAFVERLGGAHFRITVEAPLPLAQSGDRKADTRAVMLKIHERLETWVRLHPEQWFWVHNRWPKTKEAA